jgi:hypothetical protein
MERVEGLLALQILQSFRAHKNTGALVGQASGSNATAPSAVNSDTTSEE